MTDIREVLDRQRQQLTVQVAVLETRFDELRMAVARTDELIAAVAPTTKPAASKPPRAKAKPKKPRAIPASAEIVKTLMARTTAIAKDTGAVTIPLVRDRLHITDDAARRVVKGLVQEKVFVEAGVAEGGRGKRATLYRLNTNGTASA